MKNDLKKTLTFRLSSQLKDDLTAEAQAKDLTPSHYVESLILSRELDDSGSSITIQSLKERIIQIELENEKLRQTAEMKPVHANAYVHEAQMTLFSDKMAELNIENKSLRQRNYEMEEHTKQLVQQRDTLAQMQGKVIPHWMTQEGYQQFINDIKQLKTRHEDLLAEQLVLSAMAVTLENEKSSFNVYNLKDFLELKPNFLKTKILIQ